MSNPRQPTGVILQLTIERFQPLGSFFPCTGAFAVPLTRRLKRSLPVQVHGTNISIGWKEGTTHADSLNIIVVPPDDYFPVGITFQKITPDGQPGDTGKDVLEVSLSSSQPGRMGSPRILSIHCLNPEPARYAYALTIQHAGSTSPGVIYGTLDWPDHPTMMKR